MSTHPVNATSCKQSTNITNITSHNNNTTSSDHAPTHVNDGKKKKKIEKARTQRHKHLEVASVDQKVEVSHSFLLV